MTSEADRRAVADLSATYRRQYAEIRFERRGLFDLVRRVYSPISVLYPGCSFHLTPAFYFPHLVFVDRNPKVAAFFAEREHVVNLVRRNRSYRREPFIQFIERDFSGRLPIRKGEFDLLLSLFTPGVAVSCTPYLRSGGYLVTNNHRKDALEAARDRRLTLVATIESRAGRYRLAAADSSNLAHRGQGERPRQYLRRRSGGLEYLEEERYFVFQRSSPRREEG